MRNIIVAVVAVLVAACGGSRAPAPAEVSPGPNPAHAVTPAPTAAPEGSTALEVAAPTAPSVSAGESPLHVVARVVGDSDYAWLGGTMVLAGQAYLAVPNEQGDVAQIDRETPIKYYGLRGVYGRWPDSVWSYTQDMSGRAGGNSLSVVQNQHWELARRQANGQWVGKQDPTVRDGYYFGLSSWKDGAMLALRSTDYDGGPLDLEAFGRNAKPVATPKLSRGSSAQCKSKLVPATNTIHAYGNANSLAARDSGEIYVLGNDCDTGGLAVEMFDRAGVGTVTALPTGDAGKSMLAETIYAFSNGVAAVTAEAKPGRSVLFVFEQGKWQANDLPLHAAATSVTITAEGTIWLTGRRSEKDTTHLFRRPRGGEWAEVPLPPLASAQPDAAGRFVVGVWGERDDDVWVVASGAPDKVYDVLRTRPASKIFQGPEGDYETRLAGRPPSPASPDCTTFVLLYTLQKTTPATYDFPLTQAALKGHPEFSRFKFAVTEAAGRQFFGAFAPHQQEMYDESPWREGKALVALIKEKVPSSTPQLLCHTPKMVREVKVKF